MARKTRSPASPTTDTPATDTPAHATLGGPLTLSPSAAALYNEIASGWELTPAVRALLRLACEAQTKAEEAERITAVEGMTVADQKGSSKAHPAALLARDYRAQASMALQRVLSNIEG